MQSSPQIIEAHRVPQSQGVGWRRPYDWHTTPGRLRIVQIVLVIGMLLAGAVGVFAALDRVNTINRDIAGQLEPLNNVVTDLYRSLADADATVAAGFLAGGVEPNEVRTRYNHDVEQAAANLAKASNQAGGEPVTAKRIADITTQLPVYTGLVERARANNRQGLPVGVAYLRRASDLMQSAILPEAAELQKRQAARIVDAYQRTRSVPVVALLVCGVSLVGLIYAQWFVWRRTHRVFNIGLVVATGAVIIGLVWWVIAGLLSAGSLDGALRHSRSVSGALAPAQIAALQARAVESLELVTRTGRSLESDFEGRMQRLARNRGAGGALGAAQELASDPDGRALVRVAIDRADRYATAHQEVRRLDDLGDYPGAVDAAVGAKKASAATAFDEIGNALTDAVTHERAGFTDDIGGALRWLTGLPAITCVLTLVAAVGVLWGMQQRLEEYR